MDKICSMDARFHDKNYFFSLILWQIFKRDQIDHASEILSENKVSWEKPSCSKKYRGGGHTGLWGLKDVALHVQEQNQIILYKISLSMDMMFHG